MNAVPPSARRRPQTSIDILHERDALAARLKIVVAVLSAIGDEAQRAKANPEMSLTTLGRIEALVMQATDAQSTHGVRVLDG